MKLLTVIIPTYNRSDVLKHTLLLWRKQIVRNQDNVELIVCNNASTDSTETEIVKLQKEDSFFKFVNYKDHVSIGVSISRSIDNAQTKYVLLWGDDDVPAPSLIDVLLSYLKSDIEYGLIYVNRLTGIDVDGKKMIKLSVLEPTYYKEDESFDNLDSFLCGYFCESTLLSTTIFQKSKWDKHKKDIDTSNHYGYNHYSLMMASVESNKILKINYPLCIQRMPSLKIRTWSVNMGRYRLLGIPNMLWDMEKNGLIQSAKNIWNKDANSFKEFLLALIQSAAYKKEYIPLINDIQKYQDSIIRKALVPILILLVPPFTYSWLKHLKTM